jgi:hypothetical protein
MNELDTRLRAMLQAAVPEPPPSLAAFAVPATTPRRHGRGYLWSSIAAVAVVLAVVGGVTAVARTHRSHVDRPPASGPAALVLRDGDTVQGTGRIVSVPGRPVRFCAPLPVAGIGNAKPTAPAYCDYGIDLTGVDLDRLSGRREMSGAIEGYATLRGVFEKGVMAVRQQTAPAPEAPPAIDTDAVPCPAPVGGWPHGTPGGNFDFNPINEYGVDHPGVIGVTANLRASLDQTVAYVTTYTDPEPVFAALRTTYRDRLCVVRSRYSAADVARTRELLAIGAPTSKAAQVYSTGEGLSPDLQFQFDVELRYMTPELAAIAAELPAGIVRFEPWLKPVR